MRALELKSQEFDASNERAPAVHGGGGLDAALQRALREGELRLDFQPLVAVAGGATTGFEALLRWRRPGFGELAAGSFVAVAEGLPTFDEIGAWSLVEAARAAVAWPARLRVAVNLSPAQLRSPKLAATVRSILDQGRLDPRRLELEIVKTALIDDYAAVATILNALRSYGVTVALDDFGGDDSSMQALAKLPLDRLKIDRSFVVEAMVNPRCAAVIRAAARIAKELGLALTGEGVESCEQFELLRSAGCDETQGYFHSRPLPESDLAAAFERSPGGCDARSDCRHCLRDARRR
ncbi:MAG: EAL domain-containing protein [Roseiarcus sp.]|jgi:EAL domain-containing protein (putative c-di-GMP-specific phosphodiesterase class I)